MFDEIYGWDLEHSRRVIRQHHFTLELREIRSSGELFGGQRQMPTFIRVNSNRVLNRLRHLCGRCEQRELADLPLVSDPLSMDELERALFGKGLAYDAAHGVRVAIEKQRQLIDWYESLVLAPNRPAEHEVVAHVILPLLKALGWSEQLLASEWNKIDLAVFWRTPTDERHCKLVCEAKTIGAGLQDVLEQAEGYVTKIGLDECDKILLTDGHRFYVYQRTEQGWADQPAANSLGHRHTSAFLNLLLIRVSPSITFSGIPEMIIRAMECPSLRSRRMDSR